jgi:hypothetical protein
VLTPVGPDEVIREGDELVFAGVVSTIVELHRIRGLVPVSDGGGPVLDPANRRLVEAVVSTSSPLVGQSIRDANFRTVYDAAVVAVHRNGERVPGKIGEIVLEAGDTLLVQGAPGFLRAHRNSPDFYLVSEIADTATPRHDRAWIALAILGAMVVTAATGLYPISIAAFLAAGAMLLTRCLTGRVARQSVDWSILVVIGSGFGIAAAMDKTGAAAWVAQTLAGAAGGLGPVVTLAVAYALTLMLAELLHHTAGGRAGGLLRLRLPGHLPDPPDRVRTGRLPLHRLRAHRSAPGPGLRRAGGRADPGVLAALSARHPPFQGASPRPPAMAPGAASSSAPRPPRQRRSAPSPSSSVR